MAQEKPQSFSNHARFDFLYHVVASFLLLVCLVLSVVFIVLNAHSQLLLAICVVLLTLAAVVMLVRLRTYPLMVQDRIIRLEERLRLDALLPEPLRKRIPELNEGQLIALRFASDDEIPTLVELTLDKKLDRKQIKERIQNWRPDHWRV
jgi:hypothetical protein